MDKPTYEEWKKQNPLTADEEKFLSAYIDEAITKFLDNAVFCYTSEEIQQIKRTQELLMEALIVQTRGDIFYPLKWRG